MKCSNCGNEIVLGQAYFVPHDERPDDKSSNAVCAVCARTEYGFDEVKNVA